MGQVQHGVAQKHHQLFVFAIECARQWIVLRFGDNPFPRPLPKLGLRRPEFLAVATDDESRLPLFLLFLGFTGAHDSFNKYTSVPACIFIQQLRRMATRGTR
jgi:hypothetical protein